MPETRRRAAGRQVLAVLFAAYLLLLIWLVLFKLNAPFVGDGWMRHIKLVPFVRADGFGASDPLEVAGNAVVFIPFGACLAVLAGSWSRWRMVATMAGTSLLLEVMQYVLAVGSSDVSDVISNTAGGCLGLAMVALAGRPDAAPPRTAPSGGAAPISRSGEPAPREGAR